MPSFHNFEGHCALNTKNISYIENLALIFISKQKQASNGDSCSDLSARTMHCPSVGSSRLAELDVSHVLLCTLECILCILMFSCVLFSILACSKYSCVFLCIQLYSCVFSECFLWRTQERVVVVASIECFLCCRGQRLA